MFNLWFVKYENKTPSGNGVSFYDPIVFCFTLPAEAGEQEAERQGREMIHDDYVDQYRLYRAEVICKTPDEVLCFEPC